MRTTVAAPFGEKPAVDSPPRPGLDELREGECRGLVETLSEIGLVPPARRYGAGQDVFLAGDPADGLYVLVSGIVKLSKRYPGAREVVLRLVGPWEAFGDLAPGLYVAQGASARAFTDCEVVKVPKVFVERAARTNREVSSGLMALLGLELAHQRELAGCFLPRTTEARLAVLLTVLARKFGEGDGGGGLLLPRLTHFDLAAMVAATRESVTAAMRSLRQRGLIRKEGQAVSVLKPDELAQVAEQHRVELSTPGENLASPYAGVCPD